jgi:hypothetical protein
MSFARLSYFLFRRHAVLRQRLLEFLFGAEGIGGCACPEFPQGMAIALAPSDKGLRVFPALAEEGDDEIGILDGEGAELVEEHLLGLQLLAERTAWVAVHDSLQAARAWRDATHSAITVGRIVAGC